MAAVMAATIAEGLRALNAVDLSALRARIDAIRAAAEKDLAIQGRAADTTATPADIAAAAQRAGLSVEDFMAALERAKRMGLI